ncbi:MAG: Ig domain-containing protein [Candidatus Sericytochromatia bacterium]
MKAKLLVSLSSISLFLTSCFVLPTQNKNVIPPKYLLIEPSSIVLRSGDEKLLTAFVYMPDGNSDTSNKNIVWESSDRGIADIDDKGKIKAVRSGEVSITAKFKDTDVLSRVLVTVNDKKLVEKIDVNPPELKLKVGESSNLTATVNMADGTKNSNIIWSSSDNTVATVNDFGKVSAIKIGTVSIVANYAPDSRYKKSIDVTITEANTNTENK